MGYFPVDQLHMRLGTRFSRREGNRFELFIDAGQFYPVMLNAIREARHYVLMEQYLMSSGQVATRFIDALVEVAGRGVRVYVQLDHFGVRDLLESDRERMRKAGIQLAFYNPFYFSHLLRGLPRNHRKLLIIDGNIASTGGYCISDEYAPPPDSSELPWHDVMIRIQGPVVTDWQTLFTENWKEITGQPPDLPETAGPTAAGTQIGMVTTCRPRRPKEIKRMFIRQVRHSRKRVWMATAYFVPSRKILRALRRAANRGVDVRLLLPGLINDHPAVRHAGARYYHRLLHHGIRIYEFQPRFMHAKVYLCDDWVSIGSCNMDRWNLHWNLEANQEVYDAGFAREVAAFFEADFSQSHEITLPEWLERPWYERVREWLWGHVSLWLERFSILYHMKSGKGIR
jgi:phosphatidylserine/phosphatidylglycerophosphate/cardiolipin synthase-like enzyme